MKLFFIESDGEFIMTTLGYIAVALLAAIVFAAIFLLKPKKEKEELKISTTKKLAFCSMAIAVGFVASYLKIFRLPLGGSVTLLSMLFITLVGYWYGLRAGLLAAFTYSLLQFLQGPYIINFWQVCFDYLFAFTALGLSGLFKDRKNGLITGYIVAILARGLFHSIGGYLFFMSWIPDTFPKNLSSIYPLVYNYSYILAEGAITVALLFIPPVRKAMERVKIMAIKE
ncbi:MAG: proton-coupled thiamine transporter YuaJ [Clostridiaceae bacterium]|jgi:thiamine transporter|nr:proton-coupled thiamine transporter YuaJ [Clostridiaceae bacterium]